jgi:cytochrome c-type biogenesis protein CcmH/NrfG
MSSTSVRRTWSTEHVFFVAVLFLFMGMFSGYLLRGDRSTAQPPTAAAQPSAAPTAQANNDQQTAEQLAGAAAQQAEPLLKQLKADPNNPQLLTELGNVYYDAKQYPQAIGYYKQSLAIRPGDANVRTDMGTAYFYNGDPDSAIGEFNTVLKATPDHASALFNLGIVKWRGKSDAAGAAEAWERLLKAHPDHPERAKIESLLAEVRQQRASK